MNRTGAKDDMDTAPVALDSQTQEGQDYIAAMKLAARYAYAGRDRLTGEGQSPSFGMQAKVR